MKPTIVASFVAIVALAACRALPELPPFFNQSDFGLLSNISDPSLAGDRPPPDGPGDNAQELRPTNPADDKLWDKCKCKGARLLVGMYGSDKQAGEIMTPPQQSVQSRFEKFPELFDAWFYRMYQAIKISRQYAEFDTFWGIGDALRSLGASDKCSEDGGRNSCLYLSHGDEYAKDEDGPIKIEQQIYDSPDGRELRATEAYFSYALNKDDGVIIAMNRKGPKFTEVTKKYHIPDSDLPALRQSSDIAWGMWKMHAKYEIQNIKYFISLSVTNPDTVAILTRASEGELLPWPGVQFTLATDEGKAILGTPNGQGMAYMLMQHKKELGNMYVYAVNLFHCNTRHKNPCLVYHIAPADDKVPPPVPPGPNRPPPPPLPPRPTKAAGEESGETDNFLNNSIILTAIEGPKTARRMKVSI